MTREKALQVDSLLVKIETYEALIVDLRNNDTLKGIVWEYSDDKLEEELVAVVQTRLDDLLKELEEI